MKEILVSNSFKLYNGLVYSTSFNDEDYSEGELKLYSNKEFSGFLLHIHMDCEHQCFREGDSFFYFETFNETKSFILSDDDCKSCIGFFSTEKDFEENFTTDKFKIQIFGY